MGCERSDPLAQGSSDPLARPCPLPRPPTWDVSLWGWVLGPRRVIAEVGAGDGGRRRAMSGVTGTVPTETKTERAEKTLHAD